MSGSREFKVIKTEHRPKPGAPLRGYVGFKNYPPGWNQTDRDPNEVTWGDLWEMIGWLPTPPDDWMDIEVYARTVSWIAEWALIGHQQMLVNALAWMPVNDCQVLVDYARAVVNEYTLRTYGYVIANWGWWGVVSSDFEGTPDSGGW